MSETKDLSHINEKGQAEMVDITEKEVSDRIAVASGTVTLATHMMKALREQSFNTKKGSITQTAIIAGTMAVKRTYDTIPLCHQIPISSIKFHVEPEGDSFHIQCQVKCTGQTGVEMEALHGVSVAALTIYDMCKALGHEMQIGDIQLEKKSGGKHDFDRAS
ncbi:MAG: cyclic pyranopterin monophosphate synthase MoaC [Flavobacteriales bacterium]|nr:cyclic pyranopterin monophosphate synthase MoaC [Flavobacteriales bacterium]